MLIAQTHYGIGMRGRFRRFRGRGRSFGSRVRAAMGTTIVKRIVTPIAGLTIPDITATDFDNPLEFVLVECLETMDEEAISDGTVIADVPIYSRLKSMKLNLHISGVSAQTEFRWLLYKEPDGESLVTNLAAQFHQSDDTPTGRELRKQTLAKGMFVVNTADLARTLPIFVKRSTFARLGGMKENDRITLVIAKNAAGTTATLHGFGNIYVKARG